MSETDKLIKGFIKEQLIKNQIKEAIQKYSNLEELINNIKEIFLNNLNYSELINLNQSIFLPNISANFYFEHNKVQVSYTTAAMTLNNKFKTILFDKKNKEKILSIIENVLKENNILKEGIWLFAKLKDSFLLVQVVGPTSKEIPTEIRNNIRENSVVIQELKCVWDMTKI